MSIIQVENLTKVYRNYRRKEGLTGAIAGLFSREYVDTCAVDAISFQINSGELVGYIGPNGAGKSTTIKMLTGILLPTSGFIEVNGFVPFRQRYEYTKNIGVVFGQRTQLWWDIPVIESFKLLRKVYQVPENDYKYRLNKFKEILELEPLLHTPVRKLSLGQRMRCDMVASLLHNPSVLFLDEPTIGLDVIGKLRIREFLAAINREFDITIILTTHDLKEIEELCKRLIIIDHGKVLYDGDLEGLKNRYPSDRCIVFQLNEEIPFEEFSQKFTFNGQAKLEKIDRLRLKVRFRRESMNPVEIIQKFLEQTEVHDITIEEPAIEDVIGKIYSSSEPDRGIK